MSYLVDPEYAEEIGKLKWHADRGYLKAFLHGSPRRRVVYMHSLAWEKSHGRGLPSGLSLDHISGNKADNRIANLRPATRRLQNLNRTTARKCDMPRGVWRHSGRSKPYQARIHDGVRSVSLGYFSTQREASDAYEQALAVEVALEAEKAMNIWQEAMSDE